MKKIGADVGSSVAGIEHASDVRSAPNRTADIRVRKLFAVWSGCVGQSRSYEGSSGAAGKITGRASSIRCRGPVRHFKESTVVPNAISGSASTS